MVGAIERDFFFFKFSSGLLYGKFPAYFSRKKKKKLSFLTPSQVEYEYSRTAQVLSVEIDNCSIPL